MTNVERKMQDRQFRLAGRKAYRAGITVENNPYQGHQATLWEQGWQSEKLIGEQKGWRIAAWAFYGLTLASQFLPAKQKRRFQKGA